MKWKPIYEDDDIVVVDKPTGMLIIPDRWKKEKGEILIEVVQKRYDHKLFIVHRQDRDTSGLVIFAKNATSHRLFSQLFEKGGIQKKYHGLVHGRITKDEGSITKPIAACRRTPGRMIVDKYTGKRCETGVKVLERFGEYSWLELTPKTGRTHQIRVHLTAIGHPLVCDRFYGLLDDEIYLSKIKLRYHKKRRESEKPLLSHLALHASTLSFVHPVTKKELVLEAPLRKEIRATITQLKKTC